VTSALRQHIEAGSDGIIDVTTESLDRAVAKADHKLVNLFMYQTTINAAWRNNLSPHMGQRDSVVRSVAPLGLNLYYLLTACCDKEADAHIALGEAMAVLHDRPLLDAGVCEQSERIRISPHPLSIDDMIKIWSGFPGIPYRLSVAYEASVVLIESRLDDFQAKPVLSRGKGDLGVTISLSTTPRLDRIIFPTRAPGAAGGITPAIVEIRPVDKDANVITLTGSNLTSPWVTVEFRPIGGTGVIERPAEAVPEGLKVKLTTKRSVPPPANWAPKTKAPGALEPNWRAGLYEVRIVTDLERPDESTRTSQKSNALAFQVVPRIEKLSRTTVGGVTTITCLLEPQVMPEQHASAIIGNLVVESEAHNAPANEVTFKCPPGLHGDFLVRIRVDDVENWSMREDIEDIKKAGNLAALKNYFNAKHQVVIP